VQEANVLLFDAGGVFGRDHAEARQRAEALVEGMSLMGYDALNLGDEDFAFGPAFLQEQRQKANFPFLSANLIGHDGQELPWQPYVVKEIGYLKVGIVGLVSPALWSQEPRGDVEARDPVEVLDTLLPQVKKKAHIVVVLAHMSYNETVELLKAVEGINVMIAAHGGKFTPTPELVNGALLVSGGEQGKYVGQLQIVADTSGQVTAYIGKATTLDEKVSEDPAMLELMARYGFR
jgi:2',3'-cyclic-nucleotide 2'-phosphodiesterase (5'-nucleotidase family)